MSPFNFITKLFATKPALAASSDVLVIDDTHNWNTNDIPPTVVGTDIRKDRGYWSWDPASSSLVLLSPTHIKPPPCPIKTYLVPPPTTPMKRHNEPSALSTQAPSPSNGTTLIGLGISGVTIGIHLNFDKQSDLQTSENFSSPTPVTISLSESSEVRYGGISTYHSMGTNSSWLAGDIGLGISGIRSGDNDRLVSNVIRPPISDVTAERSGSVARRNARPERIWEGSTEHVWETFLLDQPGELWQTLQGLAFDECVVFP